MLIRSIPVTRGLKGVFLITGAVALLACVTNPYTERSQLLLITEQDEMRLGAEAYQQILSDPKVTISRDPREVEPVERVARRVIKAAKTSLYAERANLFEWEVIVVKDDKMLNAFALPGGKIAVYTGIFPIAKNEAGLAAILGHEVTHALARHGGERMSQGVLAQFGLQAAQITLTSSSADPVTSQAVLAALGLGANVGVLLPFSRTHESEADYIGLLLAARAGYDPREAVRVWERMDQVSEGQPAEFLSTHPSHGTRIEQLNEWMPEALTNYQPRPGEKVAELPAISPQ